jgi:hypothetical membrane protein
MRIAGYCGISGLVFLIILVLLATIISPWFRWDTNALSDLGVGEVSLFFNGTIIICGLLILLFAFGIRGYLPEERVVTVGVASIMVGSICLSLIGIFTITYPLLHQIVSLGYFLMPPLGYILISFGTKDSLTQKTSLVLGIAALTTIFIFPLVTVILRLKVGLAVPEIIHALLIGMWILNMAVKLIN